jgi:diguanylate cyclase (GGDEF)-like protein
LSPTALIQNAGTLFQHVHHDDRLHVQASFFKARVAMELWEVEMRIETPAGGEKWICLKAGPEGIEGGVVVWHGYLSDITARKRQEQCIEAMAYRDPLTELANRRSFFRVMEGALANRRARAGQALLYIDLDNFKLLNDTHGHDAGDRCLRQVAAILRSQTATGEIAARIGGDEFVLLIQTTALDETGTAEEAALRGNRVLAALRRGFGATHVSASLGIALVQPGCSVDEIIQRADRAMYSAKRAGRDGLALYDPLPVLPAPIMFCARERQAV